VSRTVSNKCSRKVVNPTKENLTNSTISFNDLFFILLVIDTGV